MLVDGVSRQQLRLLVMSALINGGTIAGNRVFDWSDWPTAPELFPLLLVAAPRERRVNLYPGTLCFNTTISIVVTGRLGGPMPGPVGVALENFSEQITAAIFEAPTVLHAVQQYTTVETQTTVTSESKQHVGEISLTFDMLVYQEYGPVKGDPLTDILTTGTVVGGSAVAGGGTVAPTITIDISSLQST
jgi:hypothetical protein